MYAAVLAHVGVCPVGSVSEVGLWDEYILQAYGEPAAVSLEKS